MVKNSYLSGIIVEFFFSLCFSGPVSFLQLEKIRKQFPLAKAKQKIYLLWKMIHQRSIILGLGLYFLINVRRWNKSPVKELIQRKKLIVWKLFGNLNIRWIHFIEEKTEDERTALSRSYMWPCWVEQTGPELLPSSPISFSIMSSCWLFVNVNLVETVSSDSF